MDEKEAHHSTARDITHILANHRTTRKGMVRYRKAPHGAALRCWAELGQVLFAPFCEFMWYFVLRIIPGAFMYDRESTAWHGTAGYGTARHSAARHATAPHGRARPNTAPHGTALLI